MRLLWGYTLGLLLFMSSAVFADDKKETSPSTSAGVLEKQIQREFKFEDLSPTKEVPLLEIDIPSRSLDIPAGISVFIKDIIIEGNNILPLSAIQEVTKSYTNREVNGAEVAELCSIIDQLYVKRGYILAWTYPPSQKIQDGVLKLQILEGTVEEVQVIGTKYYTPSFVRSYFKKIEENPFNYYEVQRALLLLNENSNLSVKALVAKGEGVGSVILIIEVEDTFPLQISAGYNNWGSATTTYNQIASQSSIGNVLLCGDSLTMMTSFGLPPVFYYLNPVYSIPLNGQGASLQLSYLFSLSNIQQQPSLDQVGWSEIGSVTFSQALARTKRFESNVYLGFSVEQMKNLEQEVTTSYDKLRILNAGASLDYIDSVQGRNFLDGYVYIGIPNILGGSKVNDPLCSRPGGGGRFYILSINGQRLQQIHQDYLLVMSATAQGTFNKLPIPEQLCLGGEGTVRGFPSCAACGDNGYYGNVEFYFPPPFIKNKQFATTNSQWKQMLNLLVFLDHGGVFTNSPVVGEVSPAYLTAIGAGFRFYGPKNLTISLDAAFPVTSLYKQFNSSVYFRINMNLY